MTQFEECLNKDVVSLASLKELCYRGVPEGGGRRAQAWRILLGYLPLKRSLWPEVVREKRALYRQLVAEMIVTTPDERGENSPVVEDHPLNPNPTSQWQSFFKDNEVLLQIDKDVRRLCPDLTFFQQPTSVPNILIVGDTKTGTPAQEKLYSRVTQAQLKAQEVKRRGVGPSTLSSSKKKAVEDYTPIMESGQEAHWEVVERILFLYAKLNPGQGYVQGMNEIIGPIYYVLASDPQTEWKGESPSLPSPPTTKSIADHAEADCFFCFTNLMSDIRDFFIKTLDDSSTGIQAMMVRLQTKIGQIDPEVEKLLSKQGIKMQYFAFR